MSEEPSHRIDRRAVIIPGAQKSGTSTLYEMLERHSQITSASVKEPQYFSLDRQARDDAFDWYVNLFDGSTSTFMLDASTFYLPTESSPRAIHETVADPRLIFVLRDPAQRAYSSYLQMHTKDPSSDRRTFDQVLDGLLEHDGYAVDEAEDRVLRGALERGEIDADYIDDGYLERRYGERAKGVRFGLRDRLVAYRYFGMSLYRDAIQRYIDVFGESRIHVAYFEDLVDDPRSTMESILRFIGIPEEEQVLVLRHANPSRSRRSPVMAWASMFKKKYPAVFDSGIGCCRAIGLGRFVDRLYKRYARPPKLKMSDEQVATARDLLSDEYEYWYSRCDRLASLWGA